MGSIWKAVKTGFSGLLFKSKNNNNNDKEEMDKANTTTSSISRPEEDINGDSDSDADDEDFVPNEANEGAGSEELSDGDDDDDGDSSPSRKKKTDRKTPGKKRKATGKPRKAVNGTFKRRRFQRNNAKDDDDEVDVNFIVSESRRGRSTADTEDDDDKQTEEQTAAQDAEEKAEVDRLWADFLTSVNEEKERRKKGQDRTIEKVVNKVVDFAGEKISVQQKVKVTVSSSNATTSNDNTNNSQDSPSSSISTVALSDVSNSNASTSTATTRADDEPVAGPSSAMTTSNGEPKSKQPRRGGISILGNDPETIGLDELDKRGLSGLLKAFQNKAAAAKRIGTLEKSKLDWEQYKRTQGLEEELTHHNRSRNTYIDKQEFLQRADYRQFEIEKGMRATQRSKRLAN